MGLKRVAFRAEVASSDSEDTVEELADRALDQLTQLISGGHVDVVRFTVLSAAEDPTEGDRFTPLPGPVPE